MVIGNMNRDTKMLYECFLRSSYIKRHVITMEIDPLMERHDVTSIVQSGMEIDSTFIIDAKSGILSFVQQQMKINYNPLDCYSTNSNDFWEFNNV